MNIYEFGWYLMGVLANLIRHQKAGKFHGGGKVSKWETTKCMDAIYPACHDFGATEDMFGRN